MSTAKRGYCDRCAKGVCPRMKPIRPYTTDERGVWREISQAQHEETEHYDLCDACARLTFEEAGQAWHPTTPQPSQQRTRGGRG